MDMAGTAVGVDIGGTFTETPATGGTFQCLQVSAPEGTIFAAKAPAACQYYYPHAGLMIDLFITLMAQTRPERVTGGQCADPMNVMFSGTSPESGEPWMFGEATAIGWAASRTQDGESGLASYGGGDRNNYPAEVPESKYSILIGSYGLLADSGRRRGGLAIFRSLTALADSTLSLWLQRTITSPWGVFGGHQGGISFSVLKCPDGTTHQLLKCSQMPCPAGSSFHVVTGGGGGYGDPAQREPDLVAAGLADGYVTQHAAREHDGHEGGQR
jgi:N-methylhydantoinase B